MDGEDVKRGTTWSLVRCRLPTKWAITQLLATSGIWQRDVGREEGKEIYL